MSPCGPEAEKRLAATQDDWLEEEVDFIDQAEPEESGGQVGPADRQVLAGLGFQLSKRILQVFPKGTYLFESSHKKHFRREYTGSRPKLSGR